MLAAVTDKLFRRRHYWRDVSFDQIARLYISRVLTIFALNVVNLFASIYLYKLGYSIVFIGLFYGGIYALKAIAAPLAAKFVARFGAKYAILLASLMRIPSLVAFAFVEQFGLSAIIIFGVFQQLSGGIYDISYLVNFSKVKHRDHAGKEIGLMNILERIAKVISPVLGGIVASVFSLQATIIVALAAFFIATIPLFMNAEPVKLGTKIRYRSLQWKKVLPSLIAYSVRGFGYTTGVHVWGLFMAVVLFAGAAQNIYAVVGAFSSLSAIAAIAAAWIFGKMIDRNKGLGLLIFGMWGNVVSFIARAFVGGTGGIVSTNVLTEVSTAAHQMSMMRVVFDLADTSGHRVAYVALLGVSDALAASLAAFLLAAVVFVFGPEIGLRTMLLAAGFYSLLLLSARRLASR